jgi:hypothetical protein
MADAGIGGVYYTCVFTKLGVRLELVIATSERRKTKQTTI